MKKSAKIISFAVAAAIALSALTGCGGREKVNSNEKPIDTTKTQINVVNYEGGFGRIWLDKAIERFETLFEDTVFENGKKGIQVGVTSSKSNTGTAFLSGLSATDYDVVITEDAFYYDVITAGYSAEITDVVTKKLNEFGEDKSIESKMDSAVSDFFKTGEGKYYALPHYEGYYSIVYDLDLFDQMGFWKSEAGNYVKPDSDGNFSVKLSQGLSPDVTSDDGLPTTYDEFFALCDYMVSKGVTPFTWAGQIQSMTTFLLYQLWADYEGKTEFEKNASLAGTVKDIIDTSAWTGKMNSDGAYDNLLSEFALTKENSWKLNGQQGKAAALDFGKRMVSNNGYYTTKSFSNDESNISAQGTYLLSRLEGTNPVAFYIDGVWWENEADDSGYFGRYEKMYGESRKTRRFALLPLPKASAAKTGEKRTLATDCLRSLVFINSNITDNAVKLAASKKFLEFLHTDNELQEFSSVTSALKPFNYTVPESKMTEMTYFGKDIVSMRGNPNFETAYMLSNNPVFVNNSSLFYPGRSFRNSSGNNPVTQFKDDKNLTVKSMFESSLSFAENQWKQIK